MIKVYTVLILMLSTLLIVGSIAAAEKADIIVAKDGSADFKTIQAAINSIPSSNKKNVTILVKNGTYKEHLAIDKSFISLIGESRDKTIIEFSVLRSEWSRANGSNVGCAVINIGCTPSFRKTSSTVTDIVIGNCTVQNTYNTTGDKTMVIKDEGNSNRIIVVGCNVWCRGHDTISLWTKQSGMYYHADCSFKGSIDAVCPRGWCYTTDCEFIETASSAPLWHEALSSQKFVIRTGKFTGSTSGFKLLNRNNSSSVGTRFILLDCMISGKCNRKGAYSEAYFYNCHGENSDQGWYKNNLSSLKGAPSQDRITAKWTFDNKWDPETTMPSVLPFSALPQPWNKAYGLSGNVELKWIGGRNADQHAVYFGKIKELSLVKVQIENYYTPEPLGNGTYYWRVDAVNETDTVTGALWSFTVDQGVSVHGTKKNISVNTSFTVNKSNEALLFNYSTDEAVTATIGLFDLQGREIVSFAVAYTHGGVCSRYLDIKKHGLSKGLYLVRLITGSIIKTAEIAL